MHVNPRISALLQVLNNPSLPGIDLSLDRMWQLLAALGNPHDKLPPTIHVAGTNGKGSTIAMLRAIYEAAGYKVHVYTSPHLVQFNERIVLAGVQIDDVTLLSYLERISEAVGSIPVTFFEATTAAALLSFAEHPVDILLLEVGLGGRLDATNAAANIVMDVITPIGLDHREFLGDTLTAIAREKAGILRPGVPCVVASQAPEAMQAIRQQAAKIAAPLHDPVSQSLPLPALQGSHQLKNALVAATVISLLQQRLPVTREVLHHGIATAHWPARLQRLTYGPLVEAWGATGPVVLDGGHNAHAAAAIAEWLRGLHQPAMLICGLMRRKDASAFFAPLLPLLEKVACIPIPNAPDSYTADELASLVPGSIACVDALDAVRQLAPVGNATLLVGGSLYLAGELLKNHG